MSFEAVPVHLLSGFLGVGKTTAVRDLLSRHAERERIAVVVNEFGDLGIDGALLSDCTSCVLKEVPGGCVCCTALADLEASLEEMLDIVGPTRIVIEPTGLARPSEIVDLLRRERFAGRLEVRPVITLLDPSTSFETSYAEGGLFRDQVDLGDLLVLNRCDLATPERVAEAEAWARALVPPKLAVLRTSHGVLPDEVLTMRVPDARELSRAENESPSLLAVRGAHRSAKGEGYEGHGLAWGPERVFDADALDRFFAALGSGSLGLSGGVARAKGIFRTTVGWEVREWAGGVLSRGATAYRRDSRFDLVLREREADDFARVDAALEEALVPEGAPLVAVETGTELLRAFDERALRALAGKGAPPEVRVGELLRLAKAPVEPSWLWVVSDGGLFGAGARRELLEAGKVGVDEDGSLRFFLEDESVGEHEDEVDACRDVPGLCALRLAQPPGEAPA